ncbi:MAG: hypothetical protein M0C28_35145 [Candidatus Moduliflexus flocculans]|nr:hypothetical protein [Candidatus Moduliflexus flocculans]
MTEDGLVSRTHGRQRTETFRQRRAALAGQGFDVGHGLSSSAKSGKAAAVAVHIIPEAEKLTRRLRCSTKSRR